MVGNRQGAYGVDAPYVPAIFAGVGVVFLVIAALNLTSGAIVGFVITLVIALWFLASAASYLYTTRVGKFVCWAGILDRLQIRGHEQVLDLGCGRGAVLLLTAERLTTGRAHGVDLWRTQDQSGNAEAVTRRNAQAEGVADRVELHTADMTHLPFDADRFDLVVSSLAIHNIKESDARGWAVTEALRVLRPGGRLAIADFRHVREYAEALQAAGARQVQQHALGWRFWYGAPWTATRLVTAVKPVDGQSAS